MRKGLWLLPLLLVGCSKQTPEEAEAAKFGAPKMMSDAEAKQYQEAHKDPRSGGVPPKEPPPAGGG